MGMLGSCGPQALEANADGVAGAAILRQTKMQRQPASVQEMETDMSQSYFELKKTSDGQFMFNLVAPNGEVIATSERYTTKAAAENGIASVKKNAPTATTEDKT